LFIFKYISDVCRKKVNLERLASTDVSVRVSQTVIGYVTLASFLLPPYNFFSKGGQKLA